MSDNANMKNKITIRTILLWTFIVALILPYFSDLFQGSSSQALRGIEMDKAEIEGWLQEIDPTVDLTVGSGRRSSPESFTANMQGMVTFETATPSKLMTHLKKKVELKYEKLGWRLRGYGRSGSSFDFRLQKAQTHYHLYCYSRQPEVSQAEYLSATEQQGFELLIIQIGYTK
ncbi:MAG: hypothetical protein AAF483_19240 [Planctomycetota bacterium]